MFSVVCRNAGPGMWKGQELSIVYRMWGQSEDKWQFQLDLHCPQCMFHAFGGSPLPVCKARELCIAYLSALRPVIGECS